MLLKPPKNLAIAFLIICVPIIFAVCISISITLGTELGLFSILFIVFLVILCCFAFRDYAIRLKLEENGCTIKYLFITKKYKWSDLKTIRIEDLRSPLDKGYAFDKCIIFSSKENLKHFSNIRAFRHYRSINLKMDTFAVYFTKYNEKGKQLGNSIPCWSCHEEKMLTKFNEWGIEPTFRLYNESTKYEFINEGSFSDLHYFVRLCGSYLLLALILIAFLLFQ